MLETGGGGGCRNRVVWGLGVNVKPKLLTLNPKLKP